jgi:hypothetical protein
MYSCAIRSDQVSYRRHIIANKIFKTNFRDRTMKNVSEGAATYFLGETILLAHAQLHPGVDGAPLMAYQFWQRTLILHWFGGLLNLFIYT